MCGEAVVEVVEEGIEMVVRLRLQTELSAVCWDRNGCVSDN